MRYPLETKIALARYFPLYFLVASTLQRAHEENLFGKAC
jgi:hypothetical protein